MKPLPELRQRRPCKGRLHCRKTALRPNDSKPRYTVRYCWRLARWTAIRVRSAEETLDDDHTCADRLQVASQQIVVWSLWRLRRGDDRADRFDNDLLVPKDDEQGRPRRPLCASLRLPFRALLLGSLQIKDETAAP